VISIGGNDILGHPDLLRMPVTSSAQVLTVYNGNLDASEAPLARVALTMFKDVILRVAFERGLAVIDPRFVCREPADYANAIEPSASGGRKIADAIVTSLKLRNRIKSMCCVCAG